MTEERTLSDELFWLASEFFDRLIIVVFMKIFMFVSIFLLSQHVEGHAAEELSTVFEVLRAFLLLYLGKPVVQVFWRYRDWFVSKAVLSVSGVATAVLLVGVYTAL